MNVGACTEREVKENQMSEIIMFYDTSDGSLGNTADSAMNRVESPYPANERRADKDREHLSGSSSPSVIHADGEVRI